MQKATGKLLFAFFFAAVFAGIIVLIFPALRNVGSYVMLIVVFCLLIGQVFKALFAGMDV